MAEGLPEGILINRDDVTDLVADADHVDIGLLSYLWKGRSSCAHLSVSGTLET